MFRWPMLILGIIFLLTSFMMSSKYEPLNEEAEKLAINEAVRLVKDGTDRFVEIDAVIDTNTVAYTTVVKHPVYTKIPTNVIYDLSEIVMKDEPIEKYIGTVLKTQPLLSGATILLQTVSEQDDKQTLLQERILAHVMDDFWILSPSFDDNDKTDENIWQNKTRIIGALIDFRHLNDNVTEPKIENTVDEIIAFAGTDLGVSIPDKAYILIDGKGLGEEPAAYYPLKDSGNALFYVAKPSEKPETLKKITGILKPWDSSVFAELSILFGGKLPARLGFINKGTASSYNKQKEGDIAGTSTAGGILTALGLLGILRKRLKKLKAKMKEDYNNTGRQV